ncbi:hypothetical protein B0T16DRAFT_423556 [Cercophora newfieldiana]|uniref:Uncharacterized protein n=1 Tax=Cercophora newfieldiana TaxID=92897 RepID=A0AA39XU20_9PEZI|nr:hypothetical protein B0T16DRAFT_423556 [Cercophora newfieldiana]
MECPSMKRIAMKVKSVPSTPNLNLSHLTQLTHLTHLTHPLHISPPGWVRNHDSSEPGLILKLLRLKRVVQSTPHCLGFPCSAPRFIAPDEDHMTCERSRKSVMLDATALPDLAHPDPGIAMMVLRAWLPPSPAAMSRNTSSKTSPAETPTGVVSPPSFPQSIQTPKLTAQVHPPSSQSRRHPTIRVRGVVKPSRDRKMTEVSEEKIRKRAKSLRPRETNTYNHFQLITLNSLVVPSPPPH